MILGFAPVYLSGRSDSVHNLLQTSLTLHHNDDAELTSGAT